MVRVAAATCLIIVGIPTSSGLRNYPGEKPIPPPAHPAATSAGDDHLCPLPFYPDDITGGPYPCSEADIYALHGSCWWQNYEASYLESHTMKEAYAAFDTVDECYCGKAPAAGCFCGKKFAKLQSDACATEIPKLQISLKCNQCVGSAMWAAHKADFKSVTCGIEEGGVCHPDCAYEGYNIIDMCAGSLTHHLNLCRKRVFPANVQKVYKTCFTPDEKAMCDYEETWQAFEDDLCGAKKKSNATSVTTKSSTKTTDPLNKLLADLSSAGITLD